VGDRLKKEIQQEIDVLLELERCIQNMQEMHRQHLEALAARVAAEGETISVLVEARRTAA